MFVGRFNASNLAAVYGACGVLRIPSDEAMVALSSLRPVAGRFQPFRSANGVTAIVDYAHTPDALVNVLATISEVAPEGAADHHRLRLRRKPRQGQSAHSWQKPPPTAPTQ